MNKWTDIPQIPMEESVKAGLELLEVIVDVIPKQAKGEDLDRFWEIISKTHERRPTL
jgi:hypothetical protein